MIRALALIAALAVVPAVPAEGSRTSTRTIRKDVRHPPKKRAPARHKRRPAPPTPRIRPTAAEPLPAPSPPAQADATVPGGPAADPAAPAAPSAPAAPLPRTLGVSAKEFRLTLTRTLVGAGDVTIELRNAGEDGHDLRIDTLDGAPIAAWDELPAEAPAVARTVTLAAGTYRLYCSLPGHAAAGMDTRLTVSAG